MDMCAVIQYLLLLSPIALQEQVGHAEQAAVLAGGAMEENHPEDRLVLSRRVLLHFLQPQLPGVGAEVLWGCALWHPVCPVLPLVWHLSASGVCGILLWLQNSSI